jgi:tRNA threonylcarbamoyladenosine biosynthesis protein TsaE
VDSLVSSNTVIKLKSIHADDTKTIGYRLGRILNKGDVVGLYGELGTGKTTMAKGIAQAFGLESRDIISASFTIIAEYDTEPPFIHIDLYRIERVDDLDEIGLWEYFKENKSITVIEWAERAAGELPDSMIKVSLLYVDETTRDIIIEGIDEKDRDYLQIG